MPKHSFMAALEDLSIVRVAGEQQAEYLHGQLTVATKAFSPHTARFAAHCDFKGKMFSAMVLSQVDDAFLLCMHKEAAQGSVVQLKKYAVFSKVEIDISEQLHAIGIAGEENIEHLKHLFPSLTDSHMVSVENDFGQAICFNDNSVRYLCYLTDKGKQTLLENSDNSNFVACDAWNTLEIEAGIANIQGPTLGQFVPQMLNFQSLHAIDFNKGCYMGQEVVARTKFLGKNKRATFLLSGVLPCQTKVQAGDNIEIQIGDSWRRAGVVVRVAISAPLNQKNDGSGTDNDVCKIKLLAVMPNDTPLDTIVRIKDTGISLDLMPLPYQVEA